MSGSLEHANRKFYDIPKSSNDFGSRVRQLPSNDTDLKSSQCYQHNKSIDTGSDVNGLLGYVEGNVIGKDKAFSGPYGLRKVVYCDYIASGRSLKFIEDYIQQEVLPEYGNTHTTTTVTSLQTTLFRHEARDIVRNAINASEHDAVIFTGSGCTAAVHKLIHALHLKEAPIVFVSPYEHHSNLLPWKEIGAHVLYIKETSQGKVDLHHLETVLKKYKDCGRKLIGCFAAASNITGILVDVDAVTIMLHQYGAFAFWDYATAGPYVDINMNPVISSGSQSLVYKDAVFISPHKFVGGVQTPGILVAKKNLFRNPVPSDCGGGSVFFVRREAHRYLQEAEMREEGGTPAIVESVRAGLVFQLKEAIGHDTIMDRELKLCKKAVDFWKGVGNLVLLGNQEVEHLPVFSFLILHPQTGKYLHHNFICAILNDVFGVQARGGCACAGPYAQDLLGIDEALAQSIEELLVEDSRLDRTHLRRYREYSEREILRPGFARLNLPYFMNEEAVQYVLDAVKVTAEHGWKLLPQYVFNPETGEWRHKNHQVFKDRKWLGYISYKDNSMKYQDPKFVPKGPLPENYQDSMEKAHEIFQQAMRPRVHIADQTVLFDENAERLRWFLLPSEAFDWIKNPTLAAQKKYTPSPFKPRTYPRQIQDSPDNIRTESLLTELGKNASTDRKLGSVPEKEFAQGFQDALNIGFVDEEAKQEMGESCPSQNECIISRTAETLTENVSETPGDQTGDVTLDHVTSSSTSDTEAEKEKVVSQTSSETVVKSSSPPQSDLVDKVATVNASQTQSYSSEGEQGDCTSGLCFKPRNKDTKSDSPAIQSGVHKWHSPPKSIFNKTVEALEEFDMIRDGDKVMICLSGGKDSLSLLHTIKQYQFYAKSKGIKFDLGAVTVDPQTSAYDPSPLKGYLAQLNVPYFYEEQNIMEAAQSLPYECASICSFCSRMKRGRIYAAARRGGYNVLAMGQHLDDLAESFLMSVFHNGILRTMKASYSVQEGDLRVIRPFVYVREKDLRQFAEQKKLPVIPENCPACFEAPKERHRMKQLLASQEVLHANLFNSLQAAIKPILSINKTGVNVKKLFAGLVTGGDEEDGL